MGNDEPRDERLYASVTERQKTDFEIAAMRRGQKPAELLYDLVEQFLANEDIPEDVREYFQEELDNGGNRRTAAATAD